MKGYLFDKPVIPSCHQLFVELYNSGKIPARMDQHQSYLRIVEAQPQDGIIYLTKYPQRIPVRAKHSRIFRYCPRVFGPLYFQMRYPRLWTEGKPNVPVAYLSIA